MSESNQKLTPRIHLNSPPIVTLDKIIGHTINDKSRISINQRTGDIAYLSGSVILITQSNSMQPIKQLFNRSNRNFNALAYSPSGNYLAAGETNCKQPEVLVFEPFVKDEPVINLKGHKSGIKGIAFSGDEEFLVSIGEQGDIRIILWDWKEGKKVDSKKLKREFYSLCFPLFGSFFVTTGPQSIKFWTIEYNSGTRANTLNCRNCDMGSRKSQIFIDACCDAKSIYAITEDPATLCVVNRERKMERWMDLKSDKGFACDVGAKCLVCACSDGVIRLFESTSLQHITTLSKPPPLGAANVLEGGIPVKVERKVFADTIAVKLDESNGVIVAAYSDRTYIIWDIKNLPKVVIKRSHIPHSAPINDIQIMPSSTENVIRFATCSSDFTIRFWHVANGLMPIEEPKNMYCKDLYQMLYTNPDHFHFKLHAIKQSMAINQEGQIRCMKVSPGGRFIACGDQLGILKIFDTSNWELIKDIQAHNNEISCIDIAEDEDTFIMATGSKDKLIHLFDCSDNFTKKGTVDDQRAAIISLSLVIIKAERKVRLITCSTDRCITMSYVNSNYTTEKYYNEIDIECKPLCLTTESNLFYTILGHEKKISILKVPSGKPLRAFSLQVGTGTSIGIVSVIVDPSCSIIITSCSDKVIKIRDFKDGKCLLRITNTGYVSALALSYDIKKLITVSMEGCIMIWSLPEELVTYCQKRMAELNIKSALVTRSVKEQSKDKMIADWEGLATYSPIKKKEPSRAEKVKESSEVALNAAAYVQNLLSKMKHNPEEVKENIDGEEEIEEEILSEEESKYSVKERGDMSHAASEQCTEFDKETDRGIDDTVQSMPNLQDNSAQLIEYNNKDKRAQTKKEPEELFEYSLDTVEPKNSLRTPETEQVNKEEDKNEELALEDESHFNEEMDILGKILMQRVDVQEGIDLSVDPNRRESLTSMFLKERVSINDELRNAYEKAHEDVSKTNRANLIFPSQDLRDNYNEPISDHKKVLDEINIFEKSQDEVAIKDNLEAERLKKLEQEQQEREQQERERKEKERKEKEEQERQRQEKERQEKERKEKEEQEKQRKERERLQKLEEERKEKERLKKLEEAKEKDHLQKLAEEKKRLEKLEEEKKLVREKEIHVEGGHNKDKTEESVLIDQLSDSMAVNKEAELLEEFKDLFLKLKKDIAANKISKKKGANLLQRLKPYVYCDPE